MILPAMIDAIKVQFSKSIFEDDFVERGMTAWLTGIEYDTKIECYQLFFDFTDFESINLKYFREVYNENSSTRAQHLNKDFYTAIEAGQYSPKYKVYFSIPGDVRNDALFETEIKKYLIEL